MKVSHLVKLTGLVVALSFLSLHNSYAACGCGEGDSQQSQEEQDISDADPDRE